MDNQQERELYAEKMQADLLAWLESRGPLGAGTMTERIFFAGWLAGRRATHASQQGEEDAARLDWLEEMGNAPGGLWLHEGKTGRYNQTGLGLRRLGRTLREAVDAARAAHPGREEGGKA